MNSIEKNWNKRFPEALHEMISRRGITQRELAITIGATEASISRYMKGERIPKITTMIAIVNALGTDLNQFSEMILKEKPIEIDYKGMILNALIEDSRVCLSNNCDLPELEGNTGECCRKCAEHVLDEYTKKIKDESLKPIRSLLKQREIKYYNDDETMGDDEYIEVIDDIVGGFDWAND